jgi:hypothetical protein
MSAVAMFFRPRAFKVLDDGAEFLGQLRRADRTGGCYKNSIFKGAPDLAPPQTGSRKNKPGVSPLPGKERSTGERREAKHPGDMPAESKAPAPPDPESATGGWVSSKLDCVPPN